LLKIKTQYKKRIYYRAGLISLILLPILCVWYLNKQDQLRVIPISPWNPDSYFNKVNHSQSHPERKYLDISFNVNNGENKIKLDYAQLEVRRLVNSRDTLNGVHFYFDDSTQYSILIKALDICDIEKADYCSMYENDMWIWMPLTTKPLKPNTFPILTCGGVILRDSDKQGKIKKLNEEKRLKQIAYIKDLAKTFWPSEFLFGFMILLTAIRLRK
jgi:hypothetical protein